MRIAIVQTSFLGDTILSTPLIAALKHLHPQAELTFVCTAASASLLNRDPLLNQVLIYDKQGANRGILGLWRMARRIRECGFERAYVLHRSWRTAVLMWLARVPLRIAFRQSKLRFLYHRLASQRATHKHEVLRNLALVQDELGDLERFAELRLFAPAAGEIEREIVPLEGDRPSVVLFPGSAWRTKVWDWRGYRKVAQHFLQQGYCVLLLGNTSERSISRRVGEGLCVSDLSGKLSLGCVLYLVSRAKLVVCNDSMALHMASAFKVPTVSIFCSTIPEFGFGPWRNRAVVMQKHGLECRPCGRHGRKSCPTGTEACMQGVAAVDVIAAAQGLLERQDG